MLDLPALTWGGLGEILENRPVQPYERLVDRIDPARVRAVVDASRETLKAVDAAPVDVPVLALDALVDCEIAALRVKAVDAPPSGKPGYLRLRLEGRDGEHSVISRLGNPEDFQHLVGQDLLVLVNLKSKGLQGEESQGMILAAGVENPISVTVL
jgi:methionyl-tRNA synthetase